MLVFPSNLNSICGALCGRNRYLHSNSRTKIIISSPFSVSRPPRRRPSEIFRKHRIFRISPIPRSGGIARNGVPPLQSGMFYRLFVFRIFANWRNVGSQSAYPCHSCFFGGCQGFASYVMLRPIHKPLILAFPLHINHATLAVAIFRNNQFRRLLRKL